METISNTPLTPPRRFKLRIVIPAVLIGVVVCLLPAEIVRGNLSDDVPRFPASASDGVITQLLKAGDGRKILHAALVVEAPPEKVWRVLTNYDQFSSVFPNISASKGVRDPDGRWHLTAEFHSIVGHWPMDVHVTHDETANRREARWDEPGKAWKINRGSWLVRPQGNGESLLEYNLELTVSPFPDFVVRAVLLDQIKPAMRAVANHAQGNQAPR